jgi:hypothetical protein
MNPKTAIKIMLVLLSSIMLFHLSILLHVIPYEITWGGRLKNETEMYVFETISILLNLLLFSVLLIKAGYIKAFISLKVVHIILWIFIILFGLNTVGNTLAQTVFEKSFTIVTLAFVILLWIALKKDKNRTDNHV